MWPARDQRAFYSCHVQIAIHGNAGPAWGIKFQLLIGITHWSELCLRTWMLKVNLSLTAGQKPSSTLPVTSGTVYMISYGNRSIHFYSEVNCFMSLLTRALNPNVLSLTLRKTHCRHLTPPSILPCCGNYTLSGCWQEFGNCVSWSSWETCPHTSKTFSHWHWPVELLIIANHLQPESWIPNWPNLILQKLECSSVYQLRVPKNKLYCMLDKSWHWFKTY